MNPDSATSQRTDLMLATQATVFNNDCNIIICPSFTSISDINKLNINDYYSVVVADRIIKEHGKAMVITANYMYANIENVVEFSIIVPPV